MKSRGVAILSAVLVACAFAGRVEAVPTFQTYISGATGTDMGADEDSWFSSANPFTLHVFGAYGNKTTSLTKVTLAIAVPQGETGTISFVTADAAPILLTASNGMNDLANADVHILTDVVGNNGYLTKNFDPSGLSNHYPSQNSVSDFLLYDLGSFGNGELIDNYNAGDGSIGDENDPGEEKLYALAVTGFSNLHFDVYGFETLSRGSSGWRNNPNSHDATAKPDQPIPEPSSVLLLGLGGLLAGAAQRKRRSA